MRFQQVVDPDQETIYGPGPNEQAPEGSVVNNEEEGDRVIEQSAVDIEEQQPEDFVPPDQPEVYLEILGLILTSKFRRDGMGVLLN